MSKHSRELQFSTPQLVGVFLGVLALNAFVFLLGISIGAKKAALATNSVSGPAKTETVIPRIPSAPDAAGKSIIQNELDAHAQTAKNAESKTDLPPKAKSEAAGPDKTAAGLKTAAEKPKEKDLSPAVKSVGIWFVQVAAVTDKPAASNFAAKLARDGFPSLLVEPPLTDKPAVFRVRIGPYRTKSEAEEAKTKLIEATKKKKTDYFLVKS